MMFDIQPRRAAGAALCAKALLILALLPDGAGAQGYGGPFLIDGTVLVGNNSGVPGVDVIVDPNNSSKELGPKNGSATKVSSIHVAPPPVLDETNPTPSTDLNTIFTQTETDAVGNLWFYFAWIRDAGSGSGFVALELQQKELNEPGQPVCDNANLTKDSLCNPWRNRSAGDVLFLWDYSGSTSYLILRTFKQDPATGQIYLPACPQGFPATQVVGECEAIVAGPDFKLSFGGTNSSDRSRGEAAINLTNVVFPKNSTCKNFANIIPNTVTGNSDTADYKDTVLFDFPDISNCGTVTVKKIVTPLSDEYTADTFTYRLANGDVPIFDGSGVPAECENGSSSTLCVGTVKHGETDEIKKVLEGSGFTLTEDAPAGYSTQIVCTLKGVEYASPSPDIGQQPFPFPVEKDEVTACVITNSRLRGTLRISKRVIRNNGGTATPDAFVVERGDGGIPGPVLGSVSTDGVTFSPPSDPYSEWQYDAGQAFDIVELSGPSGYSQVSMVLFKDGVQVQSGNCQDAIESDVVFHCIITNDDNAASLTLVKTVVNDNGGTAAPADFTLMAAGPTGFSGAGPSVSSATGFAAGTYTLSESGPAGYTASAWVCTGTGTQNGDQIALGLGQSATCTITNDDNAAGLTLVKVVVNNNGGTAAPGDFTLAAAGPTAFSGAGPSVSSGTGFAAGTYTLSESGPAGYTASAWVCTGTGTQEGNQITLGLGQTATCTITNDDDAPSLTVVKQVINNNGGNATAADFTLTAAGPTGFSGAGPSVSNGTGFAAGTYSLSESGPAGYTASAWICTGTGTQNGNQITLGLGQSATCTITNDDNAPTLTLVKVVINDNGGMAAPADFTLAVAGPTAFSGAGPSVSSGPAFAAGTYVLSESGPAGYAASAWLCTGAGTQNGNQITLGLGQSATCTITNDDNAANLTLVKVVVNDNGATAGPADFTLTAAGPTGFAGPGPSVSSGSGFAAGTYVLSESGPAGYTASAWVCTGTGTQNGNQITLSLSQSATCTIINDDVRAVPNGYTVQRAVLHDTFRILAGIRLGGEPMTVRFRLYSDAECLTQVGTDETVALVLANDGGTASTVNGVVVETGQTYYWRAEFSGNSFNVGYVTACGSERTSLAFADTLPPQQ